MPDHTAEFFDALGRRGHEPRFVDAAGTIRFDLEHDQGVDHWLLTISRGDVHVSQEYRDADTVIRTTRALFNRMATGEAHVFRAWVRNDLTVAGDARLALLVQRLLPGPPGAHHPRALAPKRRQQA